MQSTVLLRLAAAAAPLALWVSLASPATAKPKQPGAVAPQVTLVVVGTSSLREALTDFGARYSLLHPAIIPAFELTGSSTAQRRIENGDPVDIFISSGPKNMEQLDNEDLVDRTTRRILARNDLALIVPVHGSGAVHGFRDLAGAGIQQVAIGAPNSVAVGRHAVETLIALGLWAQVEPKTVQCKNVREVILEVASGHVDAGFVYRSDALIGKGVRMVAIAPRSSHSPIAYSACVVTASAHRIEALAFLAYLSSPSAVAVWRRHHFVAP